MWMWTPPSSTIRRASAAYSPGVYGIAGHWSRLASAPEIAQVMTTGSSTLIGDLARETRRTQLWEGFPRIARISLPECARGARMGERQRSYRHHAAALPGPLDPLRG